MVYLSINIRKNKSSFFFSSSIKLTFDDRNDVVWWISVWCLSCLMRAIDSIPSLPLRCPLMRRCWFSSTLVENLLAILIAFGDRRRRNDFDIVGWIGSTIGWIRISDEILWMTRTPSRTTDRRVKRSSLLSANWIYSMERNVANLKCCRIIR